jgi:hypothetical protein
MTFEETAGNPALVVNNLYPSKEAHASDGSAAALPESLDQLDELLAGQGSSAETR